ncbi:MAG: hypothetical protein HDR14_10650 [Lachnospiraceae bacterium]|nr:hypothetical protein [Lachnospiraceae bacterium]
MKKIFGVLLLLVVLLENSIFINAAEQIDIVENNDETEVILKYYQYVNDKNVDEYISLFTVDQRDLMHKHLVQYGEQAFFNNQKLEAVNIKVLTDETAYIASAINFSEVQMYGELKCVYVEQEIKENNSSTISYVCFVLAKENNAWKIERISVPYIQCIFENGEQFGGVNESVFASRQEAQMQSMIDGRAISQNGMFLTTTSLSAPTSITVYFTKDDNINYYGSNKASLNFATYLKNTVGQEWVVARYADYPAYLQAGVMASKMYAWYNTVNPKRNYAPYYACVLDNSNDQNYWCYSASNIESQGAQYLRYLENALAYANGLALVTEDTESIFETQYRTNEGNIHSGILNQAGALALAQSGYSCLQILQEYYGSAPGIRGARVKIVAHQ